MFQVADKFTNKEARARVRRNLYQFVTFIAVVEIGMHMLCYVMSFFFITNSFFLISVFKSFKPEGTKYFAGIINNNMPIHKLVLIGIGYLPAE